VKGVYYIPREKVTGYNLLNHEGILIYSLFNAFLRLSDPEAAAAAGRLIA